MEVLLIGTGGQGINLAGQMLAEACVVQGLNVIETELYGISMRGGLSLAQIIVSDTEVTDVRVCEPDIVLAWDRTQAANYLKGLQVKNDAIIIGEEEERWEIVGPTQTYWVPFRETAKAVGAPQAMNIVALGFLVSCTNIIQLGALRSVVETRFKGSLRSANFRALEAGAELWGRFGLRVKV